MDMASRSYGSHPHIHGLSHGLKTCHRHVFAPVCALVPPFRVQFSGTPEGTRLHFLPLWWEKIVVRLRRAVAGGAHPRRMELFSSLPPNVPKKQIPEWVSAFFGTPEGTRTPNPRNRNPMLYPLSHRCICLESLAIIARICPFVKRESKKISPTSRQLRPKPVVFSHGLWYNSKKQRRNPYVRQS